MLGESLSACVFVTLLTVTDVFGADSACASTPHCTCLPDTVQCQGPSALEVPAAPAAHTLVLQHSPLVLLDAARLRHLPQLRHIRLVNCSVQRVTGRWAHPHLTDIDLSSNNFAEFRLQWLDGLPELRTLNLSGNPLRTIFGHAAVERTLVSLDLSGGRWNCTEHRLAWLVDWLQRQPARQLAAADRTRCSETRSEYRTLDGRQVLDVMRLTATMLEQCPSGPPYGCSCDLLQVEDAADGPPTVVIDVYCDNRALTQFPPNLPDHTNSLFIRNNSLTDFGPVIGNQSGYRALTELYMDGNLLEAEGANSLVGSDFIHRFSILSLSGNRLQTLPLYAFDNAFKKPSFNVDSMFLGGNPWLCDCSSPFTFTFQDWLVSHNKLIRESAKIRCGSGRLAKGPPPGPVVRTLSHHELCGRLQVNWWDVAIGLLAATVAVMMLKFAYDLTMYKRTGKLPLVARKFPC